MRKLLCDRLCDCHQGLSGADDDELFGEVLAHLSRVHPAMPFSEDRVREFVTIRAYNLECGRGVRSRTLLNLCHALSVCGGER